MASMVLQVVVSPFLGVVFEKVSSLIAREYGILWGVGKELKKLSNTLGTIRLVLEDAEEKQIKDKATKDWLSKLKDAAYDADDILDEFAQLELEAEEVRGRSSGSGQVSGSLSFPVCLDYKQILFRRTMKKRIKGIRHTFDEIAAERSKFHLSPGVVDSGVDVFHVDRETRSDLTVPQIYGRDEEKEQVIKMLQENRDTNIFVCPIIGMGGLGKTTLAQWIFNDTTIVFDARIWICVSEDFGLKRITKMMIACLCEKECDLVDLNTMQNYLKKLLIGKKFLLVLDDVWDGDLERWNKLKYLLACGEKGSSVIVTTRLQTVVDSISRIQTSPDSIACIVSPAVNLKVLSANDCWSLFEQYAFTVENQGILNDCWSLFEQNQGILNDCWSLFEQYAFTVEQYAFTVELYAFTVEQYAFIVENQGILNLRKIGNEIISKCGGVPLAVKALGRLLYSKDEEVWKRVRDSEMWDLEVDGENTILPALRLSYNHLPPLFRQCFAYCSIFPKDYKMEKQMLIYQWMANGLINSSGRMEVEDLGNEIFNELLRLSFFEEAHEGKNKIYPSCKMHDLMRDLACSVAGKEYSRMKICEIEDVCQRVRIRHASVTCESPHPASTVSTLSESASSFRTLLFLQGNTTLTLDNLLSSFARLKCLRVLDLAGLWNITSVPKWIGHLKQLRYLNLDNTDIDSLPRAVCTLRSLQMLVLSRNERFTVLPESIGNLKCLRCLDLSWTSISALPESVCSLTNLQTLRLISCIKLVMLPRQIGNMKSLRHLEVYRFGGLLNRIPAGIGQLTRLETLSTFVVRNPSENGNESVAGIQELKRLNLIAGELTIKGLRHVHDPNDAQNAKLRSKTNISELTLWWSGGDDEGNIHPSLQDNNSCKEVLEGLQPHPNLHLLAIEGYPGTIFPHWAGDFGKTLPKLHTLALFLMPNVERWSSSLSSEGDVFHLPSGLKLLLLRGCPKLSLPANFILPPSIEELGLEKCNDPELNTVENLPHLSFLSISAFDEIPEAPLKKLTSLKSLCISRCSKLKSLPTKLENLKTLTSLRIKDCEELAFLTEEEIRNLTSLGELKIENCQSLRSISISASSSSSSGPNPHLTTLKSLEIDRCPELEISIIDFQHLVSLQELKLFSLPQLTCLPGQLQHVKTLQFLVIQNCVNIETLPEWLLRHPPAGFHTLFISQCHPELHRRCEKDKGEYWRKISHLRVQNIESLS